MSADITHGNAGAHEIEALEDQLDAALLKLARVEQANEETVPFEVVRRLSDGDVPVVVWREYRSLSREQLATAAQVDLGMLEAIENGKEDVPLRIVQSLPRVLRVDLDDLVPWPQGGD